ncbi:MAG: hypothetical protein PHP30_09875 [Bacteroidales bacterium]|nr:hypothetical protein [Bacteroidales bacterium]MDD2425691.1 hypothetical protein [Bacteroidales bacterium]MDD3990384.1 hypothetical protein [Bacteroidales bacterium]MDD4639573.1 hypothetical protein [Bacteroidales bacterium]
MEKKFNIEQPGLKSNPYSVPDGYFDNLQNSVSERISAGKRENGVLRILKPQLALVSVFAFVFLLGYGVFKLLPIQSSAPENSLTDRYSLLEECQLKSSFIDFYDQKTDSLTSVKKDIDPQEIIEYINTDVSILYLASLEF